MQLSPSCWVVRAEINSDATYKIVAIVTGFAYVTTKAVLIYLLAKGNQVIIDPGSF